MGYELPAGTKFGMENVPGEMSGRECVGISTGMSREMFGRTVRGMSRLQGNIRGKLFREGCPEPHAGLQVSTCSDTWFTHTHTHTDRDTYTQLKRFISRSVFRRRMLV